MLVFATSAAFLARVLMEPLPVLLPPALPSGMVLCSPGDGAAGSPGRAFWIDRFEVTAAEFSEFLAATGATMPPGAAAWSDGRTHGSLPAAAMRLDQARAFAAWRGKRLPTSSEWDWAARGPARFRYPWGDAFVETFANTAELDLRRPTLAGTFFNGRSQFSGAYDLVGNVAEWTASEAAGMLSLRYVVRGGSFLTPGADAMDAPPSVDAPGGFARGGLERGRTEAPGDWARDVGFRCAADVESVERDSRLRAAFQRLGVRDPIGALFDVRAARASLVGQEARRLALAALRLQQHDLVRRRLEDVVRTAVAREE